MGCPCSKPKNSRQKYLIDQSTITAVQPKEKTNFQNLQLLEKNIINCINEQDKLKDKDLVFFIGKTGIGKSTTLNYLARKQMEKVGLDFKVVGGECISEIGSTNNSQTHSIFSYFLQKSKLHLCDVPGLDDTEGFQVDLINSQLIIKTIQSANSASFIFFTSPSEISHGKAESLKKVMGQLLRMFEGVPQFQNSLKIAFTNIAKGEENARIEEIRQRLIRMKDSSTNNEETTNFINWMKDQVESDPQNPKYLIIQPLEQQKVQSTLQAVEQMPRIQSAQLKNLKPTNISDDANAHLKNFLSDCLKDMENSIEQSNFLQGLEFYKCFLSINSSIFFTAFKECYEESLSKLNKLRDGQDYKSQLKEFRSLSVFNAQSASQVVSLIEKSLWHSIIKEIIYTVESPKKQSGNLYLIQVNIFSAFLRRLEESIETSDKLNEKYEQYQKIQYLQRHHKFKVNLSDLLFFKEKYNLNTSQYEEPLLFDEIFQNSLKNMRHFCQKNNDSLQEWFQKEFPDPQANIHLSNIEFCKTSGLYENLELKLSNKIEYDQIGSNLIQKIEIIIENLRAVNSKVIFNLQNEDFLSFFESNNVNSYRFITFMLSEKNTSHHFQSEFIQSYLARLQASLKQTIISFMDKGSEINEFKRLLPYQSFIAQFRSMDDVVQEEIDKSDLFLKYKKNIEVIFLKERQYFRDYFSKVKLKITNQINNIDIEQIQSDVLNQFGQCAVCLLTLENINEWLPQNGKGEFDTYCEEYNSFIEELQGKITFNNEANVKCNLKRIQILLINYNENAKYSSQSVQSLQSKQKQFTSFVLTMHDELKHFTKNQDNIIRNLDFLKNTLLEYDKGLQNLTSYKSLILNFEKNIEDQIHKIEQFWDNKEKTLKILNQNSKDRCFNFDPSNWKKMKEALTEMQNFMEQSQKSLKAFLSIVYKNLQSYFKDNYDFDLAEIRDFIQKKKPIEIVVVLDLFQNIFSGQYPQIAIYLEENVYNRFCKELFKHLEEIQSGIFNHNNQMADFQKSQNNYNEFKKTIKNHLSQNNILLLEIEETKLQAIEEKMNMKMFDLIEDNHFEEAKNLMEGISKEQYSKIKNVLSKKVEIFFNELKLATSDLKESLKQTVQEKILTIISNFDQAQRLFHSDVSSSVKNQIENILTKYTEKLISKLFDSQDRANELIQIKTFLKSYLMKLAFMKDSELPKKEKNQLIYTLETKLTEKFENILFMVDGERKNKEQEGLINQIEIVSEIEATIDFLNSADIVKMCQLADKKKILLQVVLEVIYEKATLFIHSKFRFDETETRNYLMKFSESICKTLLLKEKEFENGIQKYLKQVEIKIRLVIKNIESRDTKKIIQEFKKNPESTLVQDTIQIMILNIKEDMMSNINKNNQKTIKKLDQQINQMIYFFNQQDKFLFEKMQNLKKEITEEILENWRNLQKLDTLDSQSIGEILQLIVYVDNINQWCEYKECLQQCSISQLISRIYNTITLRINQISKSIDSLDHQEMLTHYQSLISLTKIKISYIGKKRNIFEIFEKQIQCYYHKLTCDQREKYTKFNRELPHTNFFQLFQSLIVQKQIQITSGLNQLFESNQLVKLLSIQLEFIEFCRKTNKIDQFVPDFEKTSKFIFTWVDQKYQQIFDEIVEIKRNNQLQPKKIIDALKKIKRVETHFGQHIETIEKKSLSKEVSKIAESQYSLMLQNLKDLISRLSEQKIIEQYVNGIIEIYYFCSEFFDESQQKNILRGLIKMTLKDQQIDVILNLIFYLKNSEQGQKLHEENKDLFQECYIQIYNQKTENQNKFEYLKESIITKQADGDIIFQIQELQTQYDYYKEIYTQLSQNLDLKISDLTEIIKQLVEEFLKQESSSEDEKNNLLIWTQHQKKCLLEILAHVSAAWTLIDCQDKNPNGRRFVHTVQIVTIMRLLNIDTNQLSQFYNHIAQVRTGEGKSIALGITSTILALLQFKVNCCCYSKHLSERDYLSFQSFFIHFSVEKQIEYGTFFELTEMIINKPNNLRYLAENAIKQIQINPKNNNQHQKQRSVLIIDEVDFFFGSAFLGNVYAVGYQYTNQEVANLFTLIWKKKYSYLTFEKIQKSNEYSELFLKHTYLQKFQEIIDNKVKQMIEDAKKMDKHCYVLRKKQYGERLIGYNEIDGTTYGTNKGYKTAFAYCQEFERKKINKEQRNNKLCLNFNLGCFSYPLVTQNYDLILGVTGTLEHMSEFQIRTMKNLCQISKQTITPSLFGQSKFQFNEITDVQICSTQNDYFDLITNQIKSNLSKNRAILIFFSGQSQIVEYQKHLDKKLQGEQYELQILHEQTNDKQVKIHRAANCRVITLCTKSFGRGTDFKSFDLKLNQNGGIHAIQTFFSETLTEEIQIKGRVARNGDPGSYSIILLQSNILEYFEIQKIQIPEGQSLYQYLNSLRNIKLDTIDQEDSEKQQKNEPIHKLSQTLNQHLQKMKGFDDNCIEIFKQLSDFGDTMDIKINNENNNSNAYNEIDQNNVKKDVKKDKFDNPIGNEFDLVKQGSFNKYSLIIGDFCDSNNGSFQKDIDQKLKNSLKILGFDRFEIVDDEEQFIKKIDEFHQIWIISGGGFRNKSKDIESRFVKEILKQLKKKKGLFLLTDNDPFFYHANKILDKLPVGFDEETAVYMKLQGNDQACNVLQRGSYNNKLQFGEHIITNTLNQIYEGNTICYPKIQNDKKVDSYEDFYDIEIIGTSETQRPCIFVLNGNNQRGRVVFDCGFTKLRSKFWDSTAGTEKYFQNCYAWLYFLDSEIVR